MTKPPNSTKTKSWTKLIKKTENRLKVILITNNQQKKFKQKSLPKLILNVTNHSNLLKNDQNGQTAQKLKLV